MKHDKSFRNCTNCGSSIPRKNYRHAVKGCLDCKSIKLCPSCDINGLCVDCFVKKNASMEKIRYNSDKTKSKMFSIGKPLFLPIALLIILAYSASGALTDNLVSVYSGNAYQNFTDELNHNSEIYHVNMTYIANGGDCKNNGCYNFTGNPASNKMFAKFATKWVASGSFTFSAYTKFRSLDTNTGEGGSFISQRGSGWLSGIGDNNAKFSWFTSGTNHQTTASPYTNNTWNLSTYVYNGTGVAFYIDGNLVEYMPYAIPDYGDNTSNCLNGWDCSVGGVANAGAAMTIDELYIWNRALTPVEIAQLKNSYYPFTSVSNDYGLVSNVAWNDSRNIKSTFTRISENFHLALNYTNSSGFALATGLCSINISRASDSFSPNIGNTGLCLGCQNQSMNFNITMNSTNVDYDVMSFRACFLNLPNTSLQVNESCGTTGFSRVLDGSIIPTCKASPYGMRFYINNTACINNKFINFSITSLGTDMINISSCQFDREFHSRIYNTAYNSTTGLYEMNGNFKGLIPENKNITGTCNITGQFNASTMNQLPISNIAPEIYFSGIIANNNFYNVTNATQFYYGNYTFLISQTDFMIQNQSIKIQNTSGIIASSMNYNGISISSDNFRDFHANPFYLNIIVTDIYGFIANSTWIFNFTDLLAPAYSGINDASVFTNDSMIFNATFHDESLFSYNVTCDNSFSSQALNINGTSYNFYSSTVFPSNGTYFCSWKICDGHTGMALASQWNALTTRNSVEFLSSNKYRDTLSSKDNFNTTIYKKIDRISFDIKPTLATQTFTYTTVGNSYYRKSDIYPAWIVDYSAGTWFDIAGYKGDYYVMQASDNTFDITLMGLDTSRTLKLESIGEMNCISVLQKITVNTRPTTNDNILLENSCPAGLSGIISLVFAFVIITVILILNWSYIRIPALTGFLGIGMIIFGYIYIGCEKTIAIVIIITGIFIILRAYHEIKSIGITG